jgi:hypothetical protein
MPCSIKQNEISVFLNVSCLVKNLWFFFTVTKLKAFFYHRRENLDIFSVPTSQLQYERDYY